MIAELRVKDYGDLLAFVDDQAFWDSWRDKLVPLVEEVFGIVFRAGAQAGLTIEPATKDLLPLDPEAINNAFDRIVTTYTDEWWRQFIPSTQRQMRDSIRRAQAMGTGVEGVIGDLEGIFGTQRAMTIAATETTRLFGLGAQAAYSAAGLDQWEWQTVEDFAVCAICRDRNKTRHPISVPFAPAHPRCVVEGTLIEGPAPLAATRRWYEGDGIVLATADGNKLTVTPNHPIATMRGWRRADELREGDEVLCYGVSLDRSAPVVDPDHIKVPALVEEIAGLLLVDPRFLSIRMPTAAVDFHGDGVADGEVDVVAPASLLRSHLHTTGAKGHPKDALLLAREHASSFTAQRVPGDFGLRLFPTPAGSMCSRDLLFPPLRRHLLPLERFRLGAAARLDTSPQQAAMDRHAGYSESVSDGLLGSATEIEFADYPDIQRLSVVGRRSVLVEVRAVRIRGHVYNLETGEHWYASNGIISGNCRCFPRPVVDASTPDPGTARRRRPRAGETDVQEPEPEPDSAYPKAGFQKREEIERWMHRKFPKTHFHFDGTDVVSANNVAREIDRLGSAWPQIMERLEFVGSDARVPVRWRAWSLQMTKNAYAFATHDNRVLMYNSRWFDDHAKLQASIERDRASGWAPDILPSTTAEAEIMAHEFGHHIDFFLMGQTATVSGYARASGFGMVGSTQNALRNQHEKAGRKISRYGTTNESEMWAESFATTQHGTAKAKSNPYVKAQARFLEIFHPSRWTTDSVRDMKFTTDITDDVLRRRVNDELLKWADELGLGGY